jgi:hypothetical protein
MTLALRSGSLLSRLASTRSEYPSGCGGPRTLSERELLVACFLASRSAARVSVGVGFLWRSRRVGTALTLLPVPGVR